MTYDEAKNVTDEAARAVSLLAYGNIKLSLLELSMTFLILYMVRATKKLTDPTFRRLEMESILEAFSEDIQRSLALTLAKELEEDALSVTEKETIN